MARPCREQNSRLRSRTCLVNVVETIAEVNRIATQWLERDTTGAETNALRTAQAAIVQVKIKRRGHGGIVEIHGSAPTVDTFRQGGLLIDVEQVIAHGEIGIAFRLALTGGIGIGMNIPFDLTVLP